MRRLRKNRNGSAMVLAVVFLVVISASTLGIGYYLGTISQGTPPADHQKLVNSIIVTNIPYEIEGKAKFVSSSHEVALSSFEVGAPEAFSYNTPYKFSEWVYKVQGDTNAYMKIYGAANDDETYYIVIVSVSMHQLNVETPIEIHGAVDRTLNMEHPRFDFTMKILEG